MLTSFFLMRYSSRSSGPSKLSSLTETASIADSKSGWSILSVRDPDRVPDPLHCLTRRLARASRAFDEQLLQVAALRQRGLAPLSNRLEMRVQRVGQLRFHLDVADLAGPVPPLEILDLRGVRVERVVIGEHRIAFDGAGDVGADSFGIRVHSHHLFFHLVGAVRDVDGVAE